MAKYALIRAGEIIGYRDLEKPKEIAHKIDKRGDGGPFARLVIDPGKPDFNPAIESVTQETVIKEKTVEVVYTVVPHDLTEVKNKLIADIDRRAERERLKHITPGVGQALEYAYAANEARAFQSDPNGDFPLLQASVDAGEAKSITEAADLVLARNAAWTKMGADIRRRRLAGKRGVNGATDVRLAYDAYVAHGWGG